MFTRIQSSIGTASCVLRRFQTNAISIYFSPNRMWLLSVSVLQKFLSIDVA